MTVVLATSGAITMELEVLVDPDPATLPPRVRVTVTGVASTTTFTLSRLCEGEVWNVPGYESRTFADSDVTTDWMPPLNRPILYTLSANGVALCSATVIVTSATAILQDPIQPDQFLPVYQGGAGTGGLTLAGTALKEATYPNQTPRIQIMGGRYPVAMGGQQQSATGVVLDVYANDIESSDRFQQLRAGTPILVYRPVGAQPILPALSYLVAQIKEAPLTRHLPGGVRTRWFVTADLVAAVKQAAISGYVTIDQVQQLLAGVTVDQVQTKYSGLTNLDVQKNPLIYSTL